MATIAGEAPQRPEPAWMDPTGMLDRLFGPETAEEQQALEKIAISPREEEQLGRRAADAYLAFLRQQRVRAADRGKDVEYLRRLVEVVHPHMDHAAKYRRWTVYLAESTRCDARTFPGGTLIFFRGLLDAAQSEAALVTVVGHELSHLDRGHLLVRLRRMKRAQQTLATGPRPQSPAEAWDAATNVVRLWTRPFRQEDELEADRDGVVWAYESGYDPRGLNPLLAEIGKQEGVLPALIPSLLQSHPPAAIREKALAGVYEELQRTQPRDDLILGRENLLRRVPHRFPPLPAK
jgi:predicted Zn-dependent protease